MERYCLCGYPDWPGQCPGPRQCPVHGENLDDAVSELEGHDAERISPRRRLQKYAKI
jgi:hypothetical protein